MTKTPWNKNKAVGQKKAFTPRQLEMIGVLLSKECKTKERVLFNLGMVTNLTANELLRLKVIDVKSHAINYMIATDLIVSDNKKDGDYLFSNGRGGHFSREYYAKIIKKWATAIGLDPKDYATRSIAIS